MNTFQTLTAISFIAGVTAAVPLRAQSGIEVVRSYRENHEAAILNDFAELLSYPNRARDTEDIQLAATYIRDRLRSVGVDSKLLEIDGVPPLVYGELLVAGAERTLGIYVHYDGQPVDPSNWTHPPFEPTLYTASMEAGGEPRPFPKIGESVNEEFEIQGNEGVGDNERRIDSLKQHLLRRPDPTRLSREPDRQIRERNKGLEITTFT